MRPQQVPIHRWMRLNQLSSIIYLFRCCRYNVGECYPCCRASVQYPHQEDNTLLQNSQSAFKNGDFAMVAGAQINLKMLRIYGRYNIGMQNINDIDQKTSGPSADSVGVRI